MSFLPSVECGKFKLKKASQSAKILACTKNSEICATFTLNPIRTRQNFLINGPRGIDSTQPNQTSITPELLKVKNPFLLHEKINFLTKSPNFLDYICNLDLQLIST